LFDIDKTRIKGKIFELTRDTNGSGRIDIDDLEWHYLEGDGDFRSPEVCALRDQSDIIVTNPPFSLFREFIAWIIEGGNRFLILGNMNAITYLEVFPLIMSNRIWAGVGFNLSMVYKAAYKNYLEANQKFVRSKGYNPDENYIKVPGVCWFTNLDHGRRHEPLQLMSAKDNIRFSKHKEIREKGYLKYDNYDAIEVPYTDAIPNDYDGTMGVPITFLGKYCPEQFEIIGSEKQNEGIRTKVYPEQIQIESSGRRSRVTKLNDGAAILLDEPPISETYYIIGNDIYSQVYKRLFIRKKQ
jgi:hypothetical protein